MGELGIGPDDIAKLEPEVAYLTSNLDGVTTLGLYTDTGYQVAFASIASDDMDSDSLGGVSAAMTMTAKMTMQTMFQEDLTEAIVRAGTGYLVFSQAGRFIIAIAASKIKALMKNVKILRIAAQRIGSAFPAM
ncbi:MAG: hypothetical protein GF364_11385 [Candidatus Lokiarchaeota archaeon]|nr:hypothetical protein [Candidatus Lokiarchaeota archaeon]